jgi:alpha-beta hydrolase superfamily lysophospholipase
MAEENTEADTLVLVIRGWGSAVNLPFLKTHGGTIPKSFFGLIERTLTGARIEAPDLDMGTLSKADPNALVNQLLDIIDRRYEERPFVKLIIIGFSAGTVLARNLFSRAHGARLPDEQPSDEMAISGLPTFDAAAAKPWADRVDRLVLLAGVTRGWSASSATPPLLRFLAPLLLWGLNTSARLQRKGWSFVERIKRGAPFVVESRLLFLQVERAFEARDRRLPHTFLLLGSKDEYVSPADALDLGLRTDFSYIEVPDSSHVSILDVAACATSASGTADPSPKPQQLRAERIARALVEQPEQLRDVSMNPDDIDDYLDEMDRPLASAVAAAEAQDGIPVSRVVIIVHGIRDNGFWTKRVAREVKSLARSQQLVVCAPTPSYGFFSMYDFINPWGRRNATYWFLEKYAELKVRYPEAPISFVGHSNGTYLAARALELSPVVAFERILFAGSVVRSGFDWSRFGARVRSVLNLVATRDTVVAFLPGALERWRLYRIGVDVGGAGFDGFSETKQGEATLVHNFEFLAGGHGVGVREPLWRDIAAFALDGTLPDQAPSDPTRPRARTALQRILGWVSPGAPIVLMGLLVWLVHLLLDLQGLALFIAAGLFVIILNNVARYF